MRADSEVWLRCTLLHNSPIASHSIIEIVEFDELAKRGREGERDEEGRERDDSASLTLLFTTIYLQLLGVVPGGSKKSANPLNELADEWKLLLCTCECIGEEYCECECDSASGSNERAERTGTRLQVYFGTERALLALASDVRLNLLIVEIMVFWKRIDEWSGAGMERS